MFGGSCYADLDWRILVGGSCYVEDLGMRILLGGSFWMILFVVSCYEDIVRRILLRRYWLDDLVCRILS